MSAQTRQRILESSTTIILRDGIERLTLDAVAQEAGISKGGLLYHFSTKEKLIQGIVEYLVERFLERVQEELQTANEPANKPGRWLRAYIRATFAPAPHEHELSAALAAVFSVEPSLRVVLNNSFAQLQTQAEHDGISPITATVVRLATDGFWFNDVLKFSTIEEPLSTQVFLFLMDMTERI